MTKLVRCAPFGGRSPLSLDLNRFFDEFLPVDPGSESPSLWTPRADLSETESEFRLVVDLPGLTKADVNISFESDVLTISGERREDSSTEEVNFFRTERIHGRFSRSFTFPKSVDIDGIKAGFAEGVLTVNVPKASESKPRKIKIS